MITSFEYAWTEKDNINNRTERQTE